MLTITLTNKPIDPLTQHLLPNEENFSLFGTLQKHPTKDFPAPQGITMMPDLVVPAKKGNGSNGSNMLSFLSKEYENYTPIINLFTS